MTFESQDWIKISTSPSSKIQQEVWKTQPIMHKKEDKQGDLINLTIDRQIVFQFKYMLLLRNN